MAIFSIHELEEGDKIPENSYTNFHSSSSGTFPAEWHKQYEKKKIPGGYLGYYGLVAWA